MELLLPLVVRFCLVLARLAGLLMTSPLIGSRLFPTRVRVSTALILALCFTIAPGVAVSAHVPMHIGLIGMYMVREVLIGVALGLVVRMLVAAAMFAGAVGGTQMGLGAAAAMDPQTLTQIPHIGQIMGMVASCALLVFDAHHVVIGALYKSFTFAPVGTFSLGNGVVEVLMRCATELFRVGLGLAAPLVLGIFVANVGMGLLARTMPQMNVFVVGFLLTIAMGLLVLAVTAGELVVTYHVLRDRMADDLYTILRSL